VQEQQRLLALVEDCVRLALAGRRERRAKLLDRQQQLAGEIALGILKPGGVEAHDRQRKRPLRLYDNREVTRKV